MSQQNHSTSQPSHGVRRSPYLPRRVRACATGCVSVAGVAVRRCTIRIGIVTWHLGPAPLAERIRWVADWPLEAVSLLGGMFVSGAEDAVTRDVVKLLGRTDLAVTIHPAAVAFDGSERELVFREAVERAAWLQRETGRLVKSERDQVERPDHTVTGSSLDDQSRRFKDGKGDEIFGRDGSSGALMDAGRPEAGLRLGNPP